jgi:hypothetical protein
MTNAQEPFLYTGLPSRNIPRNVTHVKVDPTVKVIGDGPAFYYWRRLIIVELNEGLEWIDEGAFQDCTSLTSIRIPSTVKEIGLEAFMGCRQLKTVELLEGLESIGKYAFAECTSLRRIIIPSTVKQISGEAFRNCNSLEAIEFCDAIEQLVHEVSLPWWNHGVLGASLRTYSFLAQFNIPARMEQIKVGVWRKNIHNMLQRIPEELKDSDNDDDSEYWEEWDDDEVGDDDEEGDIEEEEVFFNSIKSQLFNYEHLQEVAPLLELTLWKLKIMEQSNGGISNVENDVKLECRVNSLSMFSIIFPNVISFLVVE